MGLVKMEAARVVAREVASQARRAGEEREEEAHPPLTITPAIPAEHRNTWTVFVEHQEDIV